MCHNTLIMCIAQALYHAVLALTALAPAAMAVGDAAANSVAVTTTCAQMNCCKHVSFVVHTIMHIADEVCLHSATCRLQCACTTAVCGGLTSPYGMLLCDAATPLCMQALLTS
jgi:hypothetical protein